MIGGVAYVFMVVQAFLCARVLEVLTESPPTFTAAFIAWDETTQKLGFRLGLAFIRSTANVMMIHISAMWCWVAGGQHTRWNLDNYLTTRASYLNECRGAYERHAGPSNDQVGL